MELRGAIYGRISDDREGLKHGITQQVGDCLRRTKKDRVRVPESRIYRENDTGASTRSKKLRPHYKALLAAIRAGEIDVVYAYSNSRLTRRPLELEELIQLHETYGVQFRTIVSGDDDLSTADGRMVARIKAAVDAAEAERISERVTRHARARAEAGRGHGGQRPYGWRADNRRVLDHREKKIITEAIARVFAGESLRSISQDFNARKVGTVTGAPWSISGLRRLLINPRLAGIRVYQGIPVGWGDWEHPIVELDHRRLVRLLTAPERHQGPGNTRKHRMTGLAICGECEVTVILRINSQAGRMPRRFYGCKVCGMIRKMDWVDTYTDAVMEEFLRGYKPQPPKPVDQKAVKDVERLRARIDDARAAFAESDVMTPVELESMLQSLHRRLRAAEDKAAPPSDDAVLDGVVGNDPVIPWLDLPLDRQRAIIAMFFAVKLHRGRPGIRTFDPATVEFVPR